ncbi:MAG: hypothetical protein ACI9N1_002921 [Flavobacteriales bacterium]|jgi:hypothetical protein
MPNTFIDNREAWLRLSEIDYLGQFVKVWLAYNAWYRNAYSEHRDRNIINELKWNSNPIGNVLRPLLQTQSEEAQQFRSDIGLLYHRLENYELRTGKEDKEQRITFHKVFLKDRLPVLETDRSSGYQYSVERRPNGHVETIVLNRSNTQILLYNQQRYRLSELEADASYIGLTRNQQSCLRSLYERSGPREIADLLATQRSESSITCGSYHFFCEREELFAAVIEIIYLMRCHLFHGELAPTKQATECYEPAYRIVRKFLSCVS